MNKRIKVIFICFVAIAIVLVMASSFFAVQSVEVELVSVYEDSTRLDPDLIGQASHLVGSNILTISERAVAEKVESAVPYAKVVGVERFFPTKVVIYVTERVPVLAVRYQGGYALIDREGRVLENVAEAGDVPVVTGADVTNVTVGKALGTSRGLTAKLLEIVSAFEGMGYEGGNFCTTVGSIDVTVSEDCRINTRAGVCFAFNDSANVYYQVVSFMNWYSVSPDYRDGGTARIDNVFNAEIQRFGIIYTP